MTVLCNYYYAQSHLQPLPVKTVQAHLQVKEEDSVRICVHDMAKDDCVQSLAGGTVITHPTHWGSTTECSIFVTHAHVGTVRALVTVFHLLYV